MCEPKSSHTEPKSLNNSCSVISGGKGLQGGRGSRFDSSYHSISIHDIVMKELGLPKQEDQHFQLGSPCETGFNLVARKSEIDKGNALLGLED